MIGSSRLGWGVLAVLGPLEAEVAGELVAEGAVLGSQACVLAVGGVTGRKGDSRHRSKKRQRQMSRPG